LIGILAHGNIIDMAISLDIRLKWIRRLIGIVFGFAIIVGWGETVD